MTEIIRIIVLVSIVLSMPMVSSAGAPSAELLKNIQPGFVHSLPGWLVEINRTLFFTADDGVAYLLALPRLARST